MNLHLSQHLGFSKLKVRFGNLEMSGAKLKRTAANNVAHGGHHGFTIRVKAVYTAR
jgi:hypothetical protein